MGRVLFFAAKMKKGFGFFFIFAIVQSVFFYAKKSEVSKLVLNIVEWIVVFFGGRAFPAGETIDLLLCDAENLLGCILGTDAVIEGESGKKAGNLTLKTIYGL